MLGFEPSIFPFSTLKLTTLLRRRRDTQHGRPFRSRRNGSTRRMPAGGFVIMCSSVAAPLSAGDTRASSGAYDNNQSPGTSAVKMVTSPEEKLECRVI